MRNRLADHFAEILGLQVGQVNGRKGIYVYGVQMYTPHSEARSHGHRITSCATNMTVSRRAKVNVPLIF